MILLVKKIEFDEGVGLIMSKKSELPENLDNDIHMEETVKEKVSRIRLNNPQNIRKFLASVTRKVNNDQMPYEKARLLMLLCESLHKLFKTEEVEARMLELENLLNDRNSSDNDNDEDNFFLKKVK